MKNVCGNSAEEANAAVEDWQLFSRCHPSELEEKVLFQAASDGSEWRNRFDTRVRSLCKEEDPVQPRFLAHGDRGGKQPCLSWERTEEEVGAFFQNKHTVIGKDRQPCFVTKRCKSALAAAGLGQEKVTPALSHNPGSVEDQGSPFRGVRYG